MWLIEVNKSPCFAYSTNVTRTLIPQFMEELAKIIVDKSDRIDGRNTRNSTGNPSLDTGDLEMILECPFVKEPVQEIRSGDEHTVVGRRIPNPNPLIEKGKYHLNKR